MNVLLSGTGLIRECFVWFTVFVLTSMSGYFVFACCLIRCLHLIKAELKLFLLVLFLRYYSAVKVWLKI